MKRVQSLITVLAMFLFVIAILITSVQFVVYGDSEYRFYQEKYEKYHVTDSLNMELEDVMQVTDYMMDYLIGKEDTLSIVTNVDGAKRDFFNEQDRLHMADVKDLFLGGLRVRTVTLMLAVVLFVAVAAQKHRKKEELPGFLLRMYTIALGVFLGLIVLLGIAFAIDFNACFTVFHKIFFTNDLWLFDPETDYMIRMLPEGFFADMAIRIGGVFVGMLLAVWVMLALIRRIYKNIYLY